MKDWLNNITNAHVKALTPYESARRLFSAGEGQQRIWLNANESPESEHYTLESELFNRYPDCQPVSVLDAYAKYAGVDPSQVVVTRGADEGIELVIRAFCEPGKDSVLICPPTYGMYAISASTFNVGTITCPLKQDFSLDLEQIAHYTDAVKVVFLCSPNNPTGTLLNNQQIEEVLGLYAGKAIVVVDEAYIEFSTNKTQVDLLNKYPNLVILRTLSKAFALAGIRCGFVLSSAQIKEVLLKVIAPYPVPDPVAQIAHQALTDEGISKMQQRVAKLSAELKVISDTIKVIPNLELVGSQCGNFVLFRSPHNPELMKFLVANNMLIRDQSKQLMLHDCLRITVGTAAQNASLVQLIKEFFIMKSEAK